MSANIEGISVVINAVTLSGIVSFDIRSVVFDMTSFEKYNQKKIRNGIAL